MSGYLAPQASFLSVIRKARMTANENILGKVAGFPAQISPKNTVGNRQAFGR